MELLTLTMPPKFWGFRYVHGSVCYFLSCSQLFFCARMRFSASRPHVGLRIPPIRRRWSFCPVLRVFFRTGAQETVVVSEPLLVRFGNQVFAPIRPGELLLLFPLPAAVPSHSWRGWGTFRHVVASFAPVGWRHPPLFLLFLVRPCGPSWALGPGPYRQNLC